jgi:methylmalonyl-CoA mutase cobalamin-binding subunit
LELASGPVPLYVGGGIVQKDLAELKKLGAAGALLSVLSIVTEAA